MYHRLLKLSTKSFDQRRYASVLKQLSSLIDINPEINDALMNKRAVVALESTIITHGMPYPQNIETAIEVEKIVREEGAVPATIAILKGRIKIGLTSSELMELADVNTSAVKTSRRDFAYVLGSQLNGGTTVAGTIICSELCGIKIFATGGIGGVHRDGENTLDISADLTEMGRSPVVVVSSGIKSILDIPRTMEYLETQGVFVSTFQVPDHEFPAFYTRKSGVKAPYNFIDAADAAKCIDKSLQLGLQSGILIGVPVPEEQAMNDSLINNSISDALSEAERVGIKGKEVTPFILAKVSKITSGKSLKTNMCLIKNNAKVAAQIAVALENIQSTSREAEGLVVAKGDEHEKAAAAGPVVIGGSILDAHYRVLDDNLELNGATYKSETKFSAGGVGRNIAEGLHKLNNCVSLISAFGRDQNGQFLRKTLPEEVTKMSKISDTSPTANCAVILDKHGDCKLCVGDMSIHGEITPQLIYKSVALLEKSPLICIDSNLSHEAIEALLTLAKRLQKPVFYEPTDMSIAGKPFDMRRELYEQIKFITPNLYELYKIADTLKISPVDDSKLRVENVKTVEEENILFKEIAELCDKLHEHIDNIIVTVGRFGVFVQRHHDSKSAFFSNDMSYVAKRNGIKSCRHYPGTALDKIVNASGAGDAFCAGLIAGMLKQKPESICVSVGFQAAMVTLMSKRAVPEVFFEQNHPCWATPAIFKRI